MRNRDEHGGHTVEQLMKAKFGTVDRGISPLYGYVLVGGTLDWSPLGLWGWSVEIVKDKHDCKSTIAVSKDVFVRVDLLEATTRVL